MITSREEIDSLAHQLELHYLRNPEPGLLFALLTDFRDADSETLPEDEDLVQYATAAIETLNAKYECPSPGNDPGDVPDDRHGRRTPGWRQALLLPSSKAVVEPIRRKVDGLGAQTR